MVIVEEGFCGTVLGAILVVGPGHPKLLEILPAEDTNSISTSRQGSLVVEAPVGINVRKTYIPFTLPKICSKKHGHETCYFFRIFVWGGGF